MIALMQEIHRIKQYTLETLFLACSIIDRFMKKLVEMNSEAPHLVLLGTVGLMIAAKMNEHVMPSFELTIDILPPSLQKKVSEKKMRELEIKILQVLDFDLTYDGPLPFLDRYAYLLNIDEDA